MSSPAVHKHRRGYRGVLTIATRTFATEAEAAAALADLKSRIKVRRGPAPEIPPHLKPATYNHSGMIIIPGAVKAPASTYYCLIEGSFLRLFFSRHCTPFLNGLAFMPLAPLSSLAQPQHSSMVGGGGLHRGMISLDDP